MLKGALLTAVQLELPVKIALLNNGSLGFVELKMKAASYQPTNVALQTPSFTDMANAAGARSCAAVATRSWSWHGPTSFGNPTCSVIRLRECSNA